MTNTSTAPRRRTVNAPFSSRAVNAPRNTMPSWEDVWKSVGKTSVFMLFFVYHKYFKSSDGDAEGESSSWSMPNLPPELLGFLAAVLALGGFRVLRGNVVRERAAAAAKAA